MKPYYADDLVTIYHGDFRDATSLAGVDHVITDPPYGRKALPLWSELGTVATAVLPPAGWLLAYSGQANLPEVMAAVGGPDLVFRWALAASYEGHGDLIHLGDFDVLSEWKPVLAYRRRPFGTPRGKGGRFVSAHRTGCRDLLRRGGRDKVHPWGQPMSEARELVARFTKPGQTILDPFLGGGTIAAAAKSLGRRAIGIEIDERWCAESARRCSQEVLGLGA